MYCPVCSGETIFLGQLGNLEWYRCRNCGLEFNIHVNYKDIDEVDPEED